MDIVNRINEKIQRLQDLNRQMGEISKKIGVLQEEGRALHSAALEIKGAIEGLAELKNDEEKKLAESQTAKLILPEGVKPVVAEDARTTVPPEGLKAESPAITLEVK